MTDISDRSERQVAGVPDAVTQPSSPAGPSRPTGPHQGAWQPGLAAWGLLFACLGVIAFWSLMPGVTMGDQECLIAQSSREMLADGDWIVPHFCGMPRIHKSPLAYWSVAGLAGLMGRLDEAVVRLPSGLAGLALVLLMAMFGRRAFGTAALGWFAAAVTGFSGAWLYYTHTGRADLHLTFWCTLAGVLFWLAVQNESRGRRLCLFAGMGAALGMGMMVKMPMPLIVLAPGFAMYLLATARARRVGQYLLETLPGIGVMLLICLPWAMMVFGRLDSAGVAAGWWQEVFLHYEGEEARQGQPWWYYAPILLGMTLPWTLSLPQALAGLRPGRQGPVQDVRILAACLAIANVAMFSWAGAKREHYLLPAMPWILLLLTPPVWRLFAGSLYEQPRLFARKPVLLAAGAVMAGIAAFAVSTQLDVQLARTFAVPVGILVGGLSLTAALLAVRARTVALYVLLVAVTMTFCSAWMRTVDYRDGAEREERFAQQFRQIVPSGNLAFYLSRPSARLVYYGNLVLPRVLGELEIQRELLARKAPDTRTNRRLMIGRALLDLLGREAPVYVVAEYQQWEQLRSVKQFVALEPKMLFREEGFAGDPDHDWVILGNRPAALASAARDEQDRTQTRRQGEEETRSNGKGRGWGPGVRERQQMRG